MVDVARLLRQNPVPVALTVLFALATVVTVGFALSGGSFRWLIRLAALCVVLAVFAVGFWVSVLGERMDERKREQRRRR